MSVAVHIPLRLEASVSQELISLIPVASGVASSLTALIALIVAIRVETRASRRFRAQLELTEKIAYANIKPVLGVTTGEFLDLKSIQLVNYGAGTAVITSAKLSKGDRVIANITELFVFDTPVTWDSYWTFTESRVYLRAGDSLVLTRLSAKTLLASGYDAAQVKAILDSWQDQLEGVNLGISYEDVVGNRMPNYSRTLRS